MTKTALRAALHAAHRRVESRAGMDAGAKMLTSLQVFSSNFTSVAAASNDDKENDHPDRSEVSVNESPEWQYNQQEARVQRDNQPQEHILTDKQQPCSYK